MSEDVFAEPVAAEAGPSPPQAATRGPVLRDAAPFVGDLPAGVRAQVSAAMGWPGDLGALPARVLADPTGRAELADALAPHVVEQFPSTPLGTLLPVLATLRDESIPQFRLPSRLLVALMWPLGPEPWLLAPERWQLGLEPRPPGSAPCWAAVADRSVAQVRELRDVGPLSVRRLVGACLDLALFAVLPLEHRCASLRALLGALADLLDGRSWLVLCLRQVSLVEHCSGPEVARQLALSSTRIKQLERLAAGRLRDALGDIRFRPVVDVAERLRARLGDGPVPVDVATAAAGALTSPAEPPLDERGSELLLWCAGPYRAAPGSLVVAGGLTLGPN